MVATILNSICIFLQVGRQAIHHAAAMGNMAVVKLLIEQFKVPATATDKVDLLYVKVVAT